MTAGARLGGSAASIGPHSAGGTVHWDPVKYAEFAASRSRPFFDLIARIRSDAPRAVVDLGCGTGELTALLARRWPDADVLGLDSSTAMLDRAAAPEHHPGSVPANLRFGQADAAQWQPARTTDVVVSNALLQWIPGHRQLLRGWLDVLPPGAVVALQVPGNFAAPSHALMRRLAESPRWAGQLTGVLRHEDAVLEPSQYQDVFLAAGWYTDVWETTYLHLLEGADPVLDWVRGTGLRPVLAALDGADGAAFEQEYARMLRAAYPPGPHGTVLSFRRIFAVGSKPADRSSGAGPGSAAAEAPVTGEVPIEREPDD